MYSITIQVPTLDALLAVANVVKDHALESTATPTAERLDNLPAPLPRAEKKAKAPAKVEAEVAEQNKEAAKAPAFIAKEAAAAEATISYDDVKNAVLGFVKAGKRTEVVGTMAKYSVENATQLKPEQYGEFLDALKKACA